MDSRIEESALRRALAWELIDIDDIVDGDLVVSATSRRNQNIRFERRRRPSYLVKRADLAAGADETVAAEARFYRFCSTTPAAAPVAAFLPPFVTSLESDRVLVLELLAGTWSLWEDHRRHGPPELSPEPAWELGRALGTLHATFRHRAAPPSGLRHAAPPYFRPHRPDPSLLASASPARLELCRVLQEEPAAGAALDAAASAWRAETVIHGDVRSENVLLARGGGDGGGGPARLWLADWELVQLGDPAWDLAGAFEDHLRFWLEGMSPEPSLEAAARLASARWPLPAIRAALRALVAGYAAAAGRPPDEATLRRAVTQTGARLIQTAWEHCRSLDRLSTLAVLQLQLAVNLLTAGERHAVELLGLPFESDGR